jgi:hypothetical protein
MHASAVETAAAGAKTSAAVKAAPAATMEAAATPAVEAATSTAAMRTAATAGGRLRHVRGRQRCNEACKECCEQQRNAFAGRFQHGSLHLRRRRSGRPATPGTALGTVWGAIKFRARDRRSLQRP